MIIKTLGDLRKLIAGKPDHTKIVAEIGPDLHDVIVDATDNEIKVESVEFYGGARHDDHGVEYFSIGVDAELAQEGDYDDDTDDDLKET